ncbi:ABC transporter ATP-binding protein [Hwanghaeella sp.]|uniref:ABC transporter ATP-binding protein n=1 Tax=Hwanghaeella sp. TaxID=2605943 RepID=UPI003CCC1A49
MTTERNSTAPSALDVEGVSHSFGPLKALDDVSLHVPEGVFVALLGINGAGKTTLFSLITRLYDNVTGSIRVWGHDVRRKPGPALAELGVVFQSRSLDRDLSIWQNLSYHAALHGMSRKEARARAETVVDLVRLGDKMDSRVAALSGGQARRAEIARALMHGPRLLLLDEPTVGLDVKSRLEVVELVRDLVSKEGVGVLWATHLFDEIRPQDHVTVLHKGKVLADAPASEIAGEETLSDAFLSLTGREAAA